MSSFSSGAYHTPPVVKNLIIINVLVFMAQSLLPNGLGDWITENLALYFWGSDHFRVWQLVTHMFLHGSVSHLFFNMFSLWMFGRTLEYDLGGRRFLTFYIITGIGAALFYMLTNWVEITHQQALLTDMSGAGAILSRMINTSMAGASGAIYGVLLGFGMMHPNVRIMLLFPPIPMRAKYFVIIFMVIELLMGLSGPGDGIAHFAHVGGMLWAFLLLRYWKRTNKIFY
ncbi:MAG: rhomboid family intramembrane serine protease [Rikenellaceae bacterium]|jgi:membrane associated rhomboid family serine protease|nr:rhomboid family intramembrane serine protease [Rikenellaceae bacterium]